SSDPSSATRILSNMTTSLGWPNGIRVEVSKHPVGIGDRLRAVVVLSIPDAPEFRLGEEIVRDERLRGADLHQLLLHEAVIVPAVGRLLHAVDGEIDVQLVLRVLRVERGREPLVIANAAVGDAPER